MSYEMLARGVVTDALYEVLAAALPSDVLPGDGLRPPEAGWPNDNRGEGLYVASATLSTGTAQVRDANTLSSRHSSWTCFYGLKSLGATRTQADNTADVARKAALDFADQLLDAGMDGGTFKVTDCFFSQLASVEPDLSEKPVLWSVTDTLTVWLDRQRVQT